MNTENKIIEIYDWLNCAGVTFADKKNIGLSNNLIHEEVEEYKKALANDDKIEQLDGIVDIFWVYCNLFYAQGIPFSSKEKQQWLEDQVSLLLSISEISKDDFEKAFVAVLISNNSKFCYTSDEVKASISKYKKLKIDVIVNNVKKAYVIKRASDKKVLKGINYKEPIIKITT